MLTIRRSSIKRRTSQLIMIRNLPKWSEVFGSGPDHACINSSQGRPVSGLSSPNRGWKVISGKRYYFKSKWEHRYALYLEFLKKNNQIFDWQYEPQTFWFNEIKRGCVSYKPDFRVINWDKKNHWVEVKGYMDSKSLTKIKRFRKYYPDEDLIVIDKKWFVQNNSKLRGLIKDWE